MHAHCPRTSKNRPTQARCCSLSCRAQLADLPKEPAQSGTSALGKLARVLVQPPTKSPRVHNRASTPMNTLAVRHGVIRPAGVTEEILCTPRAATGADAGAGTGAGYAGGTGAPFSRTSASRRLLLSAAAVGCCRRCPRPRCCFRLPPLEVGACSCGGRAVEAAKSSDPP